MNHFLYDELEIPFSTVRGLYDIDRVREFYERSAGFIHFALTGHRLIALTSNGEEFVGFVEHPSEVDLPKYRDGKYE